MREADAVRILRERVEAGGRLVTVQSGDLCAIKSLRERCHEAGVPTLLVAGAGSG